MPWVFVFCCNLFIPLLVIFLAYLMLKKPPKRINSFYGYRTSMSRKNQDTWDFAHKSVGRLWWKLGWISLLTSALVQLPFINSDEDTLAMLTLFLYLIQCLILVLSILPVERALKKNFNSDGSRK